MIGIARRNWALRLSVVLNVCVLLYVCAHFGSSGPWIEEQPTNWAAPLAEAFGASEGINGTRESPSAASSLPSSQASVPGKSTKEAKEARPVQATSTGNGSKVGATVPNPRARLSPVTLAEAPKERLDAHEPTENLTSAQEKQPPLSLREAVACNDKSVEPRMAQRGDYWVLYNYVPMSMSVRCWESVTYTTHADYTFLDNLEPLLERWRAPVSIAIHAPGTDFQASIDVISYLRTCGNPLVSQLVTFHLYFSSKHVPKSVPSTEKILAETYNCSRPAPWVNVTTPKMYKSEKKLLYPVNVGRNIARESAPTRYVLASDIELYPSPDLPPKFLEMIRRRDHPAFYRPNPKVFVLPIFEVNEKSRPPRNKTRLVQMLKAGTAIPFHKKLCPGCHNVPREKEWQEAPETEGLHVFHVGKRTGPFFHWEPIFIGTNDEPLYDERLSWEGMSDKMMQGYALCVLDYDFLILDNAYLVHRPGIKVYKKDPYRNMLTAKTNALIKKIIVPELKILYGSRKGCTV
ncbi:beta-1,4-glucuronyltransferase 1 isoform X2 [Orussus abietinus]|uniref:beta-1,4-glucuronyltransferase 1 isoform X2 n=1 Tax=Orussus abietinus TaxID=222816 RepID=UPI000C715F2C|nr:beta-1,4-glucuronyltransferase 1 isoform X2 [Orussus abietinus]